MDSPRIESRMFSFGKFVDVEVRGKWPGEFVEPIRHWLNAVVVKTLDAVIETRRIDLLGGNPASMQTSGYRADLNGNYGSSVLSPELEAALANLCVDPLTLKNLPPSIMTTTRAASYLEAQQQNEGTGGGHGGMRPTPVGMQQNNYRNESSTEFLGLDSHLAEPNYTTSGSGDKNDFHVMAESVKTKTASSCLQWTCVRGPCQCNNNRGFDHRDGSDGVNGNLGVAQLQVPPINYGTSAFSVPKTPSPEKSQQPRNVFEVNPSGHHRSSSNRSSHRRDASYCPFCKSNGSNEDFYSSHQMRENGKIVCPILRRRVCVLCKATGDNAHTIKYCPYNEKGFYASAAASSAKRNAANANCIYLTGSPDASMNDGSLSYVKSGSIGLSELSSPSLTSLSNVDYVSPRFSFSKPINGRERQSGATGSATYANDMTLLFSNEEIDELKAKIEEHRKRIEAQQFGFKQQ